MSKPLADTNTLTPAPVVGETEKDDVPPSGSATVIDELPNGYDTTENVKVHWFRGTLFQTLIVGMASFLAPGAYAALAATGAGGLANVSDAERPLTATLANHLTRSRSETPRSRWRTL